MRVLHGSRLTVLGGDFAALVRVHAEWALGVERFAGLRGARLDGGVSPALTMAEVIGDAESAGSWRGRLQLVGKDGTLGWLSAMKVARVPGGVEVEHVAICDPRAARGVDAPEVVRWILDEGDEVAPAGLAPWGAERIDADEVGEIVAWLADPGRAVPVILVAVDNASRSRLVDVDELARRLAGMAAVVGLESVRASFRLRDMLVEHGFSDMFGCYHGGVRIYWPGLQRGDNPYDHPLVLQPKITAAPPGSRAEYVAGILGAWLTEDIDVGQALRALEPRRPEGGGSRPAVSELWARLTRGSIAELYRQVAARDVAGGARAEAAPGARAEGAGGRDAGAPRGVVVAPVAAVRSPAARPAAEVNVLRAVPQADTIAALKAEIEALRGALAAAEAKAGSAEAGQRAAEEELRAQRPDAEALEVLVAEVEEAQREASRTLADERRARQRAEQERDELAALLEPPATVTAALALAEKVLGERLIVLKSARASAEESPYREPQRVLDVLLVLALAGQGDVDAVIKQVFGNAARWKPRDSPETSRAFGAQRTWMGSDGVKRLFTRHVTLGHGVDARTCLQVYYDVTSEGRIEVAWVGEHRPTVSVDT